MKLPHGHHVLVGFQSQKKTQKARCVQSSKHAVWTDYSDGSKNNIGPFICKGDHSSPIFTSVNTVVTTVTEKDHLTYSQFEKAFCFLEHSCVASFTSRTEAEAFVWVCVRVCQEEMHLTVCSDLHFHMPFKSTFKAERVLHRKHILAMHVFLSFRLLPSGIPAANCEQKHIAIVPHL